MRKGLAACAVFLAAGMAAAGLLSVHDRMEEMTLAHNRLEANLLSEGPLDDWERDAALLDGHYAALADSYAASYGGAEEAWRGYCEESRGALAASSEARRKGDGAAAREAFFRLAQIREFAHKDFQPGLLKRLSRLFKHKRKESGQ